MAYSVNKVTLLGNLGRDPEVRFTQGGRAVANFTIATTESWGQGPERQEKTEWHKIVVWGKLAELCGQYLSKGRQVYVEGRIQTRKYQDRDGQERYITEIVAREIVFLSGGDRQSSGQRYSNQDGGSYQGGGSYGQDDRSGYDRRPPQDQGSRNTPPDDAPGPEYDDNPEDDIPF